MTPIFSPTKILDSLILMQIVKDGPLHGYALTACIEETFGWKPSQTAVYNSLKEMENNNFVVSEEKIEHGRAQKIYSITEEGRQFFDETRQKLQTRIRNVFHQMFAFAQLVTEIENEDESEIFQERIQNTLENMEKITFMISDLMRIAPKETQTVVENTFSSLKDLASKFDLNYQEEENKTKKAS
jgi:DNA-binding PadR family transcriptional regulator